MEATVEVLVIEQREGSMARLCESLAQQHIATDIVRTEAEAFDCFQERGGHRLIVFGPDVGKAFLIRLLQALRAVDPGLRAVCFGLSQSSLADSAVFPSVRCLPDFHPSSRAGIGALQRFLGESM